MKKWLLVLLLVFTNSFADGREQKIQRLMDAQGLSATFEQQRTIARKQNHEQANHMIDQMLQNLNPNNVFKNRFKTAIEKFISATENSWTTKDIVSMWAQYYGSKFSDAELDDLLAFYESDLGKKEAIAGREALVDFSKHFNELGKPIIETATKQFIQDLQLIVKECKCNRSKKST
jgi:hypothetical protein